MKNEYTASSVYKMVVSVYERKKTVSFFDSDLAEERCGASFLDGGVLFSEEEKDGIRLSRLCVTSKEGARAIERPCGKYLTVSFHAALLLLPMERARIAKRIAALLGELLPNSVRRILVLGLGNRHLTADSVGPLCTDALYKRGLPSSLAALSPGTMAQSGMESVKVAKAASLAHGADALLLVDALAAQDKERLLCAVELCDTGLSPGTGVGNHREAISRKSVGVPTVAIGIPTMMRGSAFLKNALSRIGAQDVKRRVEKEAGDLFVIPSALDDGIAAIADTIAQAILFYEESLKNK